MIPCGAAVFRTARAIAPRHGMALSFFYRLLCTKWKTVLSILSWATPRLLMLRAPCCVRMQCTHLRFLVCSCRAIAGLETMTKSHIVLTVPTSGALRSGEGRICQVLSSD